MRRYKLPSSVPVLLCSLQLSRGAYLVQCRRGVQSLYASSPMAADDISDPTTSRGKRTYSQDSNHTANPTHQGNNNSNDLCSQTDNPTSTQTNEPAARSQWELFQSQWDQKKQGKHARPVALPKRPSLKKLERKAEKAIQKESRKIAKGLKPPVQQISPNDTTTHNSTASSGNANSTSHAGNQGIFGPSSSLKYPTFEAMTDEDQIKLGHAQQEMNGPGKGLHTMADIAKVKAAKQKEDEEVVKASAYPPVPTAKYMEQASKPAREMLDFMQPLLIILDLNGTLLHRTSKKMPPRFVRRPALNHFLERVTARHMVMVWSSAQPATVEAICRQIFSPVQFSKLVAIWNRSHLGLPGELYRNKVQVYKQLERVWADKKIQAQYPTEKHRCGKAIHHTIKYHPETPIENEMTGVNSRRWDQSNTVLIDDSRLKAAANPYNIFEVSEFTNDPDVQDELVLKALLERIKLLARSNDVSRCLHSWSKQGGEATTIDRDQILDLAGDEVSNQPIISKKNKKELKAVTYGLTKADEKTEDNIRRLIKSEKELKRPRNSLYGLEGEPEAKNEENKENEEDEEDEEDEEEGGVKLEEGQGEIQANPGETTESISSFLNSPELLSDDSEAEYVAQLKRSRLELSEANEKLANNAASLEKRKNKEE